MTHIASNLSVLREQKKISIGQLSELSKIPENRLLLIESGSMEPGLNDLLTLAEVLNIPVTKFLTQDLSLLEKKHKEFTLKFLALDIDGVLTDGGMYYSQSGDEFKKFNAKDGLAIKTLTASGIMVGFISSGINSVIIENRAELLGVQKVYVGTWKKAEILAEWCKEMNIGFENIAYVGDDINDLPAIEKCGLTACPADAADAVKSKVDIVLSKNGGEGCVREFVEQYIMEIK